MSVNGIKHTHWDMITMFVVLLFCDTVAQILFKKATLNIGEIPLDSIEHLIVYLIQLCQNIYLWLGVFAMVISFFSWLAVISKIDLSKAHLITCLAYGTVPICSFLLFNEMISFKQFTGVVLIVIGAYIASISEKH